MAEYIQDLLDSGDAKAKQYEVMLLSLRRSAYDLNELNSEIESAWDEHDSLITAASKGNINEYVAEYAEGRRRQLAEWDKTLRRISKDNVNECRTDETGELAAGPETSMGG